MKYTYTRYTGDDLEDIDIEELVSKLSRLLLASGFGSPAGDARDPDDPTDASDQRPEQDLHDAMLEALLNGGLLSSDAISQLLGDAADGDGASKLEQLAQRLIEQMAQQGYITRHPDLDAERRRREGQGDGDGPDGPMRFEVTDKGLDFLGYRALRDLLGSVGRSSLGRHDTRDLATGVEASGAPEAVCIRRHPQPGFKRDDPERGPTHGTGRHRRSWHRRGVPGPDGRARANTRAPAPRCIMLDCSHSMILYGEDRFTPAKRKWPWRSSHLIRTPVSG